MLVATFAVGGELVFCSLAAYAFARMRFPGRDVLFLLFLGTLMIPFYITMIPAFIVVKWLGLVNTLAAVVVPRLASAFGTFLLRQFFLTIPAEIEDAARIDGASRIVFLVRILLPLSVPALATFGVFLFLGTWNSFLWPLLVLNDPNLSVLQLGLARFRGEYVVKVSLLMAATLLSVLPVMVVFLIGQKHLVRGVVLSGIKG
jgi:multiple sugar transport system permease protein